MGRIPCTVIDGLAQSLKPKEYIYSFSMDELLLSLSANVSYRKTAMIANRVTHRSGDNALRPSTLEGYINRQGGRMGEALHDQAGRVLADVPGMSVDGLVVDASLIPESILAPLASESECTDKVSFFAGTIDSYNDGKESCDQIKDTRLINDTETSPDNCVYVSIDDVGVRHQKDSRRDGGSKDGKVVENTVIHVQSKEGEYVITDVGMNKAFKLLVSFLFSNHLLENRHLYFFSDGAGNIRKSIETHFKGLCPYVLMLDWYHLEKKMTELLSMALKGPKDVRHEIRTILDHKLWAGNFDDAKDYIKGIDVKYIKNQVKLDEAIAYLDRKKEYACCYALRKELGYRNSSNPAEKANDLVVANRQKHKGMSWSYDGSGSLASITALIKNGESSTWITEGRIPFEPVSQSSENLAA